MLGVSGPWGCFRSRATSASIEQPPKVFYIVTQDLLPACNSKHFGFASGKPPWPRFSERLGAAHPSASSQGNAAKPSAPRAEFSFCVPAQRVPLRGPTPVGACARARTRARVRFLFAVTVVGSSSFDTDGEFFSQFSSRRGCFTELSAQAPFF